MKTLQNKSPYLACEPQNPLHFHKLHYQETSTPPPLWLKPHAQAFLEDTALIRCLSTSSKEKVVLSQVNSCADVLSCGCVGLCLLGCWQDVNTHSLNSRPSASLKRNCSFSSGRRLFLSRDVLGEEGEIQGPSTNDPMPSPFSSPLPSPSNRNHSLSPPQLERIDLGTVGDTSTPLPATTPQTGPAKEIEDLKGDSPPCTRAVRRKASHSSKLSKHPPIPVIVASKESDPQVWDEIMDLIEKQASQGVTFRYSPVRISIFFFCGLPIVRLIKSSLNNCFSVCFTRNL